jgi:hypothetical protein
MLIQQRFTIRAPLQKVWDFFLDVKTMSHCLPGLEELRELDERNYEGTLKVKIGPISANFQGRVTIAELSPEAHHAAMTAAAKDPRVASSLNARMVMDMREVAIGETEVAIDTDLHVFGKLGQFGYWVFRKKANDMMEDFANRVRARLE